MLKIISEKRRAGSLRVRQNFAKIPQAIDIPNLIEIQEKMMNENKSSTGSRYSIGLPIPGFEIDVMDENDASGI